MRFTIYGKNMHVPDNLKDLLKKKFAKFDRYFNENTEVFCTFSTQRKNNILEVTIPLENSVLRAEDTADNWKSAIAIVINKLEGQLRKHKTKIQKHYGNDSKINNLDTIIQEDNEEEEGTIVKNKRFALNPMSAEEATLQMDLLGHDFFIFLNAENNDINVVYKRKDGNYGLIEPYV